MADTPVTLSTSIIKPSSPTPPQHMFLSSQDFIWRWFHYNQRILFFKAPYQPFSFDFLVAHLKSSLASALVEFFPWAGRAFEQDNGRLALDCNDAGVPFIEASIDVPFSSLENDGFMYQPFFKHLAPHGDVLQWTGSHLPLLSVQVTKFPGDEGFVLGIGHSHMVADGSSLWHFMKSWGECARGIPLSVHPVHMREALGPEKLILPPPCPEEENDNSKSPFPEAIRRNMDFVQRNFHFTPEMVRKLKKIATITASSSDHEPFSSLQALSAHTWKHVTTARDVDKSKKTALFLLANMRPRMVPPLPEGYFGNAIHRDSSTASKEELQQESLGETTLRVQRLIKTLDETSMRILYGKVEVLPLSKVLEEIDFSMPSLQVFSSPRFPVYDVDFGWGSPLSVQCPYIRSDGEMVWFAGREGGGSIDVTLALTEPVMERLEQDESFLSF